MLPLFFFFSSRRRHTRSLRDWSSDVLFRSSRPSLSLAALRRRAAARRHRPGAGERADHVDGGRADGESGQQQRDRKSTRLNSSHVEISYAVFCLKKKKKKKKTTNAKER